MSAYANKFVLELNDVARVVFSDERAPIRDGLPMSIATVAEIVMTRENAKNLRDLLNKGFPPDK